MKKARAEYGLLREANYRTACEAFAFELGCTLVERDGEIFVIHPDASDERLPVDAASRHPWFDAWKVLGERVPSHVYDRVVRDSAFGRL
jgi:hypothetical protein